MVIDGEEQLAEPVRLTAWRAPTDNDRNIKLLWGSYNIWQGENLDKLFSKVYACAISEGKVRTEGVFVRRVPAALLPVRSGNRRRHGRTYFCQSARQGSGECDLAAQAGV